MSPQQKRRQPEYLISSVGRLCALLLEAQPMPAAADAQLVWKAVLGLGGGTDGFLDHYSGILKLVDAARIELLSLDPTNRAECNQVLDSIERMFVNVAPGGKWDLYKNHLSKDALRTLLHCAKELTPHSDIEPVSPHALTGILELVQSLSNEIANASIRLDLKKTLLEQLNWVTMAILSYRSRGTKGLIEALDMSVGVITRHKDDLIKVAETQPSVNRYLHAMAGITKFADEEIFKIGGYKGVIDNISKQLPP